MTTTFQLIAWFNDELLAFPPYVAAFNEMERLLTQFQQTGLAQHLLIVGESGTGKTTLCMSSVKKYPCFSLPEADVLPVLYVPVPPAATIKGLAEAMLMKLGDPGIKLGDVSAKTRRVVTLMRGMKVQMLLIDEAQHMCDRGQQQTHYKVGDWLKAVIDATEVPTILVGLPRAEELLQVNEQLRRRFSRRLNLQVSPNPDSSIEAECLQMFISLGSTLPFRLSNGRYTWDELGARLYHACDARIAYVKKLLVGAIRVAMERSLTEVDPSVLEEVFAEEIWWEGRGALNPFNERFSFRRLNRPNEPFETTVPRVMQSSRRG